MSSRAMSLSVRGGRRRSCRAVLIRDFRHVTGAQLVEATLREMKPFDECYEDDTELERSKYTLHRMAVYARSIESALETYRFKSEEQLSVEAFSLAKTVKTGTRKGMIWKTTCRTGRAKWSYEATCLDFAPLAVMLKREGQMPDVKTFTFDKNEFEDLVGDLTVQTRSETLELTSDVRLRIQLKDKTFKFSGYYGVRQGNMLDLI